MEQHTKDTDIYNVLSKVISLIGTILIVPIIIFFILSAGYVIALTNYNDQQSKYMSSEIKMLIFDLWKSLFPLAEHALSIIGPILILVIIVGIIKWLVPIEKISLRSISDNLPSILAILIIGSISILPVMGQEIPSVMSNIALVVVGFYFGKLQIKSDKTVDQ
ncbi:hypothetical protein [Sulfuricurvum sp.]|uniref:hypothetical protein n=1 Tax=Sulfuricurvum sp. TaxID=2025608 RepID=UPI00261C1391|nr:hypothetical protein [Sulfuricurvum sp.]MDD3597368.1 hypothetical protein [Sulfuricurvum sp.]